MDDIWEVRALKYADRNSRTRADSFVFDDNHDAPHPMDYFIWVLTNGARQIVVDTGYDADEAARRDRPILRDPAKALEDMGLRADAVEEVILTHLHYDHAGSLHRFPNATFHLQEAEMAFATGPCMCHPTLQMPFTADHVCEMVRKVYSGRVVFHQGAGQVAPGVEVHCIGGHSRGLQAVRVKTVSGWLCLASDASHFYENFEAEKPFPIVVDVEDMLAGFRTIRRLASHDGLVIPGHDPLVTERFAIAEAPHIWRLDRGPR
ncbi:glyoxylase-like metal-dependent hydrolase (beta-lactamase superfamily II) [Rubricella aquisinus]|uniref:Glyoxylase-like metal-dependent hydrolase (Beta-lactamase superfamily II) n=1 Tax=Rubricella aquisinus TaxID=2028108 RepID=A0A840WXK4_9RHOB|nr:N-acyl homoserine lactonase family protein [Rubricella aquisinus]MBB5515094.1 glyoxylase-like metal-dependent hydrolase (beta-lactamase superfamily II) [Rubricella aquisinus]